MSHTYPAPVRMAVADPKGANTESLISALSFVDDIEEESMSLITEELSRRDSSTVSGYSLTEQYA